MVNTKEYETFPELGKVTKIVSVVLKDHLGDNAEAWKDSVNRFPENVTTRTDKEMYLNNRLDEEVLVITFDVLGAEYTNFFTIPKTQGGYMQSNLRKIKILNKLPDETDDWIGKNIRIIASDRGFPQIEK